MHSDCEKVTKLNRSLCTVDTNIFTSVIAEHGDHCYSVPAPLEQDRSNGSARTVKHGAYLSRNRHGLTCRSLAPRALHHATLPPYNCSPSPSLWRNAYHRGPASYRAAPPSCPLRCCRTRPCHRGSPGCCCCDPPRCPPHPPTDPRPRRVCKVLHRPSPS